MHLQGMAIIQSQDVEGFGRYLAQHANTICGRHPIAVRILLSAVSAKPSVDGFKRKHTQDEVFWRHCGALVVKSGVGF